METISQVLFWVANSLLIPDILLLLLLFIRALLLVGGIYNQYMAKRKNDKRLNDLIKNLTPDKVDDLRKALPAKDNSLYIRYLRDLLTNPASQDYADYLLSLIHIYPQRQRLQGRVRQGGRYDPKNRRNHERPDLQLHRTLARNRRTGAPARQEQMGHHVGLRRLFDHDGIGTGDLVHAGCCLLYTS